MKRTFAIGISVLIAVAAIIFTIGSRLALNYRATLASLQAMPLSLLLGLSGSAFVSGLAKAGKLQLMQHALGVRIPFLRTVGITFTTDSAFLISPFGAAGYGVNLGLLQRAGSSWLQASTVVAGDQVLDFTFFAIVVPLSILCSIEPLARLLVLPRPAVVAWTLVVVVLTVCMAWACRGFLLAMLGSVGQRIHLLARCRTGLRRSLSRFRRSWTQLLSGSYYRLVCLLALTSIQWLLRYGALWAIFRALGYALPPAFVFAVQAVVLHAALWTGIPAGGGSGDLGLAAAFAPWVGHAAIAPALILWRFTTLICPLALGGIGMLLLSLRRLLSGESTA